MAVRTAAAQDLDVKISALLTSLDTYLDLAEQSGEPANIPADYFWRVLISLLVARPRMAPLLLRNPRGEPAQYAIAAAAGTHDIETLDPNA
jgi:hypothetical protein